MAIDDYSQLYADAGQQYGVDPKLLMAQGKIESGGDPDAYNNETDANGIAQIIPDTAKRLGVDDPSDPKQAIPAQAKLMAENLKRYGSPELAVAAYHGGTNKDNWGPKTKDYQNKVMNEYKQMAQVAPDDEDPFEMAKKDLAEQAKTNAPENDEDPFEMAKKDLAEQAKIKAAPTKQEAGPEWLQNVGKVGDYAANKVGDAAWNGVQDLGASMTPLKMGAIVPSLAVAPAMSALAKGSAAIPLVGRALGYAAGAAPADAGIATNLGYRAASGGAQGAIVNKMMGSDAGEGGATGAALNTALPPILKGAGAGASMLTGALTGRGSNISPELAQLAKTASDKHGIEIPGGLLSTNPLVRDVYSTLNRFGMTPQNNNIENFTTAAGKTFGENTPKLNRATMDSAEDRIGNMFDDVWKKTPQINISNKSLDKLVNIKDEAEGVINDNRIGKQIDNILNIAAKNNGALPSQTAQFLVSTRSPLHKLTRLGNDPAADYASDIKNTIYDALGENAPKDVLDKYSDAKKFYKNYKTVENAKPDPVTGELSPTSLANSVKRTANKFGTNGLQDLQSLGDIGQQFKLTPSSGTAEKLLAAKVLGSAASGIRYNSDEGIHYDPMGAAYGATALLGGSAAGRYLSSSAYRDRLVQSAMKNQSGAMMNLLNHNPTLSNSVITGNRMLSQP